MFAVSELYSLTTACHWENVFSDEEINRYTNNFVKVKVLCVYKPWILRARDRDRDILARLRFGHQRPLNRRCPNELGHQRPLNRGCPQVSKPVSQDIQSICYCLHTGIFRLDTCDLVVAGVLISISPKYLYLYLALKVLTYKPYRCRFK